jgi:hypothetical protein
MDCQTAVKTRTRLLDLVEADGTAVISCYFPLAESGQVIRIEGCRHWQGGLVWPHP